MDKSMEGALQSLSAAISDLLSEHETHDEGRPGESAAKPPTAPGTKQDSGRGRGFVPLRLVAGRSGARHLISLSSAFAAATALVGCVHVPDNPVDFNKALQAEASPTGDWSGKLSCLSMDARVACVRPGMKLVVLETDAGDPQVQFRTIVETRSEWIIPTPDRFGQEDLFHLSRLIAAAPRTATNMDPAQCYRNWTQRSGSELRTEFVTRVLDTMLVRFNSDVPVPQSKVATASGVQMWMRRLPDRQTNMTRQLLTFAMPTIVAGGSERVCDSPLSVDEVHVFESGTLYQNVGEEPRFAQGTQSLWYSTSQPGKPVVVWRSRSYVGVEVPITVRHRRVFVPVDSSLADVAELAGVPIERIRGVRRIASLVPSEYARYMSDSAAIDLRPTMATHYLVNASYLPISERMMGEMLIAPGDEIVID